MLKDNRRGFGLVSILLHWSSAVCVIFLFGLGLYMTGLGYYDPWYHKGPSLHISIGLLFAALLVFRLCWRLGSASPAPLPEHGRWLRRGALAVKILLYLLLFTVVASGYLVTTAEGDAPGVFGLVSVPVLIELTPANVDRAGWLHLNLSWAIILLAGVHALAALAHHFGNRDRTLLRMLKPVPPPPDSQQGDKDATT